MTDRVPTNHATIAIIQDDFDNDLVELNCNVHPLDGASNKASKVGKSIDSINGTVGQSFGKEGSATNLVKVFNNLLLKATFTYIGMLDVFGKLTTCRLSLSTSYLVLCHDLSRINKNIMFGI